MRQPEMAAGRHRAFLKPLRYRLVAFDLDGTLVDSFAFFVACQRHLAARHGFRAVADQDVEALRSWTPRQLLRHTRLPFWKLPRVARDFRSMMAAQCGAITPFPGVHDALRQLQATGATLALVSSNARSNCRRVLGPDIWALLSHVECGASLFGKASHLRRVCRAAGITPGDAIYVGDQATDAGAARDAGVAFGAVSWGYATPAALDALAPAVRLRRIDDLAAIAAGNPEA